MGKDWICERFMRGFEGRVERGLGGVRRGDWVSRKKWRLDLSG